jgi:hypothetical protein
MFFNDGDFPISLDSKGAATFDNSATIPCNTVGVDALPTRSGSSSVVGDMVGNAVAVKERVTEGTGTEHLANFSVDVAYYINTS